jgi:hypothetical protein
MAEDKHVPAGVWLKCNLGSVPQQLKILPRPIKLYDEDWATQIDAIPFVNIPSFGTCVSIKGPCAPGTVLWDNPVDGNMTVAGAKPLKDKSTCKCAIGGEIKIFFDRQAAASSISADQAERKAAEAKEESSFWMYAGIAALVVVGVAAVVCTGGAAAPLLVAAGQAAFTGAAIGAGVGSVVAGSTAYASGERGWDLVKSTGEGTLMGAAGGAIIGATGGFAGAALAPALGVTASAATGALTTAALAPSALYLGKAAFHEGQALYYEPTLERGIVFVADLALSLLAVKGARDAVKGLKLGVNKSGQTRKDPVDPITGHVFYSYCDFELPGPIPL